MSEKIIQNHSGSGHNISAETVYFGRPQFEMTEDVMRDVLQQVEGVNDLTIQPVGSNRSGDMVLKLMTFLRSNAVNIKLEGGARYLTPPLERPIELRGGHRLFVDSSK